MKKWQIEHTARMLERDWGLPPETARAFAEKGEWVANEDGSVSFLSAGKPPPGQRNQ